MIEEVKKMTALHRFLGGCSFRIKIPSLVLLRCAVFLYSFVPFSRIASQSSVQITQKEEVFRFTVISDITGITDVAALELFVFFALFVRFSKPKYEFTSNSYTSNFETDWRKWA